MNELVYAKYLNHAQLGEYVFINQRNYKNIECYLEIA